MRLEARKYLYDIQSAVEILREFTTGKTFYPVHSILSLIFLLFLSNPLHAELRFSWSINDLVKIDAPQIELMAPDSSARGKYFPLKRVETKQMVYLYSVMKAIEEVSETRAELFIVTGENANAFASRKKVSVIPSADMEIITGKSHSPRIKANRKYTITYDEKKYGSVDDTTVLNIVSINFGMLDLIGYDVHIAAALIGHELAHIKLEHGKTRKNTEHGPGVEETRFIRDQERDADYLGMIWAIEAGYDPEGRLRLEESKEGKNRYSKTHPSSRERLIKSRALARRLSR